jgi:uncharacterized membrane protein (UPF0127 family)
MRCSAALGGALLGGALLAGAVATAQADHLPLVVGGRTLQAEVAATPAQRQRGLMGRSHLAADSGMLFVFETPGRHCFWMRDTPLPLAVAFIGDDGRVTGVADMRPRSDTRHCAAVPVRFALEIAQGSFLRAALTPGATVSGLPRETAVR